MKILYESQKQHIQSVKNNNNKINVKLVTLSLLNTSSYVYLDMNLNIFSNKYKLFIKLCFLIFSLSNKDLNEVPVVEDKLNI